MSEYKASTQDKDIMLEEALLLLRTSEKEFAIHCGLYKPKDLIDRVGYGEIVYIPDWVKSNAS